MFVAAVPTPGSSTYWLLVGVLAHHHGNRLLVSCAGQASRLPVSLVWRVVASVGAPVLLRQRCDRIRILLA